MRWTTLLLCAALSSGCGDKDKKAGTSGGKVPAATSAALAQLPKTSSIVAGFNFAQLRGTKMYADNPKLFAGLAIEWLDRLKSACSIDVFAQVDRVTVAVGSGAARALYVLVEGKLSKSAVEACVKKDAQITQTVDGKVTSYAAQALDEPLHVTWLGPTTALVADDKQALVTLLAKGGGAASSPLLSGLLEKVDTSATAWGVGQVPDDFPAAMIGIPKPGAFWGHAIYHSGAKLLVGARFADAGGAKAARKLIDDAKGGGGGLTPAVVTKLLQKVKVTISGSELEARASMSAADVEAISQMAAQ